MTAQTKKPCYFVTANDAGGWCRAGGHYLADTPSEAISLFVQSQNSNPYVDRAWASGLTFKAKRSKSYSNAMNARAA